MFSRLHRYDTGNYRSKEIVMKLIDLTGKRFGKLIVLRRSPFLTHHTKTKWECKCDCGIITNVYGIHLNDGDTKSCGCSHYKQKSNHPRWKGVGDLSGRHFHVIRKTAKNGGRKFELSMSYLWKLFLSQDRRCALTGVLLVFDSANNIYDGTASLDRIDSSKDYVYGNVQWVHKEINIMKNKHSVDHFVELCQTVVNYDRNKKAVQQRVVSVQ